MPGSSASASSHSTSTRTRARISPYSEKIGAQRVDLAGVAAVERGQGEQRGVGHGGGFGGETREF